MSFWSALGNFFKKAFGFVIKSDPFKVFVDAMLPVAIQVVTEVGNVAGLSSADKRNAAFGAIASAAKKQGVVFADHFIYLLIEVCVAKIKGTLATQ